MAGRATTDLVLWRRLVREASAYGAHLAVLLGMGLLGPPLALLGPVPLKIVVDSVLASRPLPGFLDAWIPSMLRSEGSLLGLAAGLLLAVAFLGQLRELCSSMLRTYTGERLVLGLRARLFAHLQRLSFSYHDARGVSDAAYRIQIDAQAVQNVLIEGLVPFVSSSTTVLLMLYVTLRLDAELALVAFLVAPILLVLLRAYRPRLRGRAREVKELESAALAVVHEALGALRVVRAFGQEDREEERFVGRSSRGLRARLQLVLAESGFGLLVALVAAAGTASVLWIGAHHVRSGALTLGDLLLVIAYLGQLYEPLKTIGKKAASLQSHLAGAERVFSVLDRAPEVVERPSARRLRRAQGGISYDRVSFAYDGVHLTLRDISFEVRAGARVAVVGATGAGKTTLMSLLTRFHDPTAGRILLDGVDLCDYRLADLRRQFAIVLQEPVLFSTSIAENIAYARPEASEREVIEAARAAGAHEFIAAQPEGYETPVGERGMQLSGGERQRVALARAFLRDAPILLLDEPTSSVDLETEAVILEALARLMRGRTTFLITHRPSLLDVCDMRLRLEEGRLVEARVSPALHG